tara:strand:+ start:311 stop:1030 length:720 start_codon:yes stop_codon:yes gene_type:complete
MSVEVDNREYKVWAVDDVVYGPVSLQTVLEWVADQRILGGMWLYPMDIKQWTKAADLSELKAALADAAGSLDEEFADTGPLVVDLPLNALRKVKALDSMNEQQLGRFVQFMEIAKVERQDIVVTQGDPGDAMYLVLAGRLRVRQLISGKESVLATLGVGEFFGEISLFDEGPRSADVVANETSTLLIIRTDRFHEFVETMPEVAAPFLLAIGRTMGDRIRADNERHKKGLIMLQAAKDR